MNHLAERDAYDGAVSRFADFCRTRQSSLIEKQGLGFLPRGVVRGFRKVIQFIRNAIDERSLYTMKSLHYEKLKGKRSHQRSLRVSAQWRLIIEIIPSQPKNIISVIGIEDYH